MKTRIYLGNKKKVWGGGIKDGWVVGLK